MQGGSACTFRIVVVDFFVGLHFRAFIETGREDSEVLFSLNNVTDASKVDFVAATGGSLRRDGRKGVLVYMRWTDAPSMDDSITITLWQNGVQRYGEPEKLPEEGFNPHRPTAVIKSGD